eukprot:s164_g39.t1
MKLLVGGQVKNGLYHPLAHLTADLMVNVPIWFLLALAAIVPSILILELLRAWAEWNGNDSPAANMLEMWLLLAAYIGFNDTFAQLCGTLRGGSAMGIMLFLMQTILNMIFNGTLLAHADKVPWVMRWLFSVVPSKYTFRSGVKLEFDGLVFEGFAQCSDPSLPVAVRAVMPCWGEAGASPQLLMEPRCGSSFGGADVSCPGWRLHLCGRSPLHPGRTGDIEVGAWTPDAPGIPWLLQLQARSCLREDKESRGHDESLRDPTTSPNLRH